MHLSTEQSYAMLERFGCYREDVCDRCGRKNELRLQKC